MIISPSVSQVLRGIAHEMSTSLKDGLDNPVKSAQIDTIVGVLTTTATRAENESRIIAEETAAILKTADDMVQANAATAELNEALKQYHEADSDAERYDKASCVLSCMGDIGTQAPAELYAAIRELMTQRLNNENFLIGGGFEAAGRG